MTKTITRRSPEEIVRDLQAKIAAVEARAAAKEARSKPESAAFIAAARSLQKASAAAQGAKDAPMEGVVEAALATLGVHASEAGIRMPQPRERKAGAKRKKTAAA